MQYQDIAKALQSQYLPDFEGGRYVVILSNWNTVVQSCITFGPEKTAFIQKRASGKIFKILFINLIIKVIN
jgi:hypothetical protein